MTILKLVLISTALLLHLSRPTRAFTTRSCRTSRRTASATIPLYAYHGRNGTESSSFWRPSEENSSRLKVRRRFRSALNAFRRQSSRLEAADDDATEPTWSGPVDATSSGSLGGRDRVKAVLQKAKSRTGVNNFSEEPAGLVISQVASIGGLVENSDLVIKKKNGATTSINGASSAKVNGAAARKPASMGDLVVKGKNATNGAARRRPEMDALLTDVPTPPPDPLPFKLPQLSKEQKNLLMAGERIQEQSKMGREGSGYVVVDVKAPPYIIWECLLDFEKYPELINTVRSMEMFTSNKLKSGYHAEKPVPPSANKELRHYGIPSVTRAAFVLSKFQLNIAAIHNYRPHPDGHYMVFNLDPECTNIVLKSATGIWHTQSNPDGRGEEYTRVWLLCELKVSRLLPQFIVDYTAKRAMPRATNWLKPHVEPIAEQWFMEQKQLQKQK